MDVNRLARALCDSSSLDEAEGIAREVCGLSDIDYERVEADRIKDSLSAHAEADVDASVRAYERDAAARGIDYVTFRRLAEATRQGVADTAGLRRHLVASRPSQLDWPLWSIVPETVTAGS